MDWLVQHVSSEIYLKLIVNISFLTTLRKLEILVVKQGIQVLVYNDEFYFVIPIEALEYNISYILIPLKEIE